MIERSRRILGILFVGGAALLMLAATFLPWGAFTSSSEGGEARLEFTVWEWRLFETIDGETVDHDAYDWGAIPLRGTGLVEAGGVVLIVSMSVLAAAALTSSIGLFVHRGVSLVAGVLAALATTGMMTAAVLLVMGFVRFGNRLMSFEAPDSSGFQPAWGMVVVGVSLGAAIIGTAFVFSRGGEPGLGPRAAGNEHGPEPSQPTGAGRGPARDAALAQGSSWTRLKPPAEVRHLVCPQCKAPVEVPAGAKPACWTCGFSG